MYTATTPKLRFEIEDEIDLTEAFRVFLTINDEDDNTHLEKDVEVDSPTTASVVLSQEETLALPLGTLYAQLNYLYLVDSEVRRGATDTAEIYVKQNNKNEVVIE